jgi:hypothetical protein
MFDLGVQTALLVPFAFYEQLKELPAFLMFRLRYMLAVCVADSRRRRGVLC